MEHAGVGGLVQEACVQTHPVGVVCCDLMVFKFPAFLSYTEWGVACPARRQNLSFQLFV